jgi:hypothetical protein
VSKCEEVPEKRALMLHTQEVIGSRPVGPIPETIDSQLLTHTVNSPNLATANNLRTIRCFRYILLVFLLYWIDFIGLSGDSSLNQSFNSLKIECSGTFSIRSGLFTNNSWRKHRSAP